MEFEVGSHPWSPLRPGWGLKGSNGVQGGISPVGTRQGGPLGMGAGMRCRYPHGIKANTPSVRFERG